MQELMLHENGCHRARRYVRRRSYWSFGFGRRGGGLISVVFLLRHCLPNSLEHMLMFIYLTYSVIALLYETVPAFEASQMMECFGDLSRYCEGWKRHKEMDSGFVL